MSKDVQIAVLIRTGRAAAGLSQAELSKAAGTSKTTIARLETLEGGLSYGTWRAIEEVFKGHGVLVSAEGESVTVTITGPAFKAIEKRIQENRRTDYKGRT
jgi:transcriptional regulator with XRE-family HTH domain